MAYCLMNIFASVIALIVAVRLQQIGRLGRIFKISLLVVPLSFPWLYFGISRQAWGHGDPGPRFMNVPVNEIALSFIMTFANAGILLLNCGAILHEAHRRTEAKYRHSQDKKNSPS